MDNVFTELEYLSNPVLYEKYKQKKCKENNKNYKIDKKFYKKRIIQLMKDLYNNDLVNYNVPLDKLKEKFKDFVDEGIEILKLIDKNDILQDEYKNIQVNKKKENSTDVSFNQINNDTEIFKKPKTNKIEDCMPLIKKTNQKKEKLPIKKEIDLKDPGFKIKGLKIKD